MASESRLYRISDEGDEVSSGRTVDGVLDRHNRLAKKGNEPAALAVNVSEFVRKLFNRSRADVLDVL